MRSSSVPLRATVYWSGLNARQAPVPAMQLWADPTSVEPSYSRNLRQTSLPGVSLRTEPRTVYALPAVVELIGQGEAYIERLPAAVAVRRAACGPVLPPPTSASVPLFGFQAGTT